MALLLTLMADSQTRTEVLGAEGGPGPVAQEAGVVGILMVKDLAVVAGASNLTMIFGQMMTFQVVQEDQTVHHHPVAVRHPMVVVVAHRPLVIDHHPLVTAHHLMVVVVAHPLVTAHHPLAVGTEASVVLASHADNPGTEHLTAQTSNRWRRCAASPPHGVALFGSDQLPTSSWTVEHNAKVHLRASLPCDDLIYMCGICTTRMVHKIQFCMVVSSRRFWHGICPKGELHLLNYLCNRGFTGHRSLLL